MRTKEVQATWTGTSPASASTAVSTTPVNGLEKWDGVVIDAVITGGTGGTIDVYLQRKIASNVWADWVHFPQVAAATTKRYTTMVTGHGAGTTPTEIGVGTDASPSVVLAANTSTNVPPTGQVRVVMVGGAGTSAGATQTIYFTPFTERV